MEHTAIFEEQVALSPMDMRREIRSIDTILAKKLQEKLEGRCSRHGFVLQNSIRILSRSMGTAEKGRFTGSFLYHVQAEGGVLNPPDGVVISGEVIRKNKMGIYVNYRDAVRVIVPRDLNIGNEEFESVGVGETIEVEIKKSRFQVNDEYILSVGLFKGRKGGPREVVAEEGAEEAEAEEAAEEGVEEEAEEAEAEEGAEEGVEEEAEEAEAEEGAEEAKKDAEEAEEEAEEPPVIGTEA
jgi:DNA-directed RNA polymerase subunit E'/Rpb7